MPSSTIGLQRLINQRISHHKFSTPAEVVRWMGAMQAQDYKQSLWAVGSRLQSGTVTDVEAAIENGDIVRTWPMRGTIHFVPPEDAKWMLELCASRTIKSTAGRRKQLGLDDETLQRSVAIFQDALAGGKRFARGELLALLEAAGINMDGQRGYHTLSYAALLGVLCIGPMHGTQQTFVLLEEWVPNLRSLSPDEALAELTQRYFTSHAPATIDDFARWSGLTKSDVKRGLHMLGDAFITEEIEGIEYYLPASLERSQIQPPIHLLAAYDEYVLGYKNRDAVLAPEHAQKIVPGKNGVFYPTVVVEGQIVGVWRRKLSANAMELTFQPFAPFGEIEEQVLAQASTYSAFMQLPIASMVVEP